MTDLWESISKTLVARILATARARLLASHHNRRSAAGRYLGGLEMNRGTSPLRREFTSKRVLFLGIALLLCTMFTLSDSARSSSAAGCQASASVPLFPTNGTTCGTALRVGDQKDILITMTNTSSTTPAPGTPVAAMLTGNVTFTLACTNTTCATELPGTVVFVPVGGNGCVSNDPGVTSCSSVDANHVSINVGASGVALAAGETFHAIATIRVQVAAN